MVRWLIPLLVTAALAACASRGADEREDSGKAGTAKTGPSTAGEGLPSEEEGADPSGSEKGAPKEEAGPARSGGSGHTEGVGEGGPGTSTEPQKEGPPPDSRLIPMEPGRTWTTETVTVSRGRTERYLCEQEIRERRVVDGRDAFVSESRCSWGTSISYVHLQGDTVWLWYENESEWIPAMKEPVQEGASWTYSYAGTRTQTWHKEGPTTVKAGTFDDCWRIDYVVAEGTQPNDVNYSITCRGVGTVKTRMRLSNGYRSDSELTAKNF